MPEFLAETYTAPGAPAPGPGELAQAAAQAGGPGGPARFLGAIAVPAEETCFYLYQAATADAVRAAMTAAGLRPDRITPASLTGPPPARPGTGAVAWPPQPRPGPQATSSPRPATRKEPGGPPTTPDGGRGR
jgi:hypothetical protein